MNNLSKPELLKQMREYQEQYARLAEELKVLRKKEDDEEESRRQMKILETFKTRYKFYSDSKEIDWAEVEKLITSSFGEEEGYRLGWNEQGYAALGVSYRGGGGESVLFESLEEIPKYEEREEKRKEIAARKRK